MLPSEPQLEVRSRLPTSPTRRPPVLFVHGGYCDAWCWDPNFLPWFARHGVAAHALSLRGHGKSAGRDLLWATGLDDYAADVERVCASLEVSAGAGRSLDGRGHRRAAGCNAPGPCRGAARAAAASGPSAGRSAARGRTPGLSVPDEPPGPGAPDRRGACRAASRSISPTASTARRCAKPRSTSRPNHRARCSTCRFACTGACPSASRHRCSCSARTVIASADLKTCVATARHHGVTATLLPGMAHMLMLEPGWEAAARALHDWMDTLPRRSLGRSAADHELPERLRRQRLADPVALECVAAAPREEVELRTRSHAFRDHVESEAARQADDRLGDRRIAAGRTRGRR